jgi:hypothetical protein
MGMSRSSRLILPVLLLAWVSGCCTHPKPTSGLTTTTLLFFGRGMNDGGEVSPAQFDQFVGREVASRFPDGFSIVDADGLWAEPNVTYRERSKVLLIVHDNAAGTSNKIDAIREAYKKQFAQSAVLRVDLAASKVEF